MAVASQQPDRLLVERDEVRPAAFSSFVGNHAAGKPPPASRKTSPAWIANRSAATFGVLARIRMASEIPAAENRYPMARIRTLVSAVIFKIRQPNPWR